MIRFFRWIGWDDPFLTYRGLFLIAGVILLASLAVAVAIGTDRRPTALEVALEEAKDGYAAVEERLVRHLKAHPDDAATWKFLVGFRASLEGEEATHLSAEEFLAFLETSTDPGPVVLRAWYAFHRNDPDAALAALEPLDEADRWIARAEILERLGRTSEALAAYDRALELDPARDDARRRIIEHLVLTGDDAAAARRLEDPAFARAIDDSVQAYVYHRTGDWPRMVWRAVRAEFQRGGPRVLAAAGIVGLAWYVLAWHLGRAWSWPRIGRLVLAPAAVVLGYASAVTLMPVLIVQGAHVPDMGPDTGIAYNVFYCIVVIGLKEELVKFLFFLPLVPFLVGSGNRLRILTTASLVGLGFAIAENVGYFVEDEDVFARFITANFAHMVWTGIVGYYFVRALQCGLEGWRWFGSEGTKIVVLHGVYDWLILDPAAEDYSFAAAIVFIVLSQSYLRLIVDLSPRERRPVPLTRLFVAAMALAVGAGYVLAAGAVGYWDAFRAIAEGFLGTVVISAMFFREFDETISG